MTTELEQEFYKIFEIKKQYIKFEDDYGTFQSRGKLYPLITSYILLQMICIINKSKFVKAIYLDDCNYFDLKNTIISKTITIMKNEFFNKKLRDKFKQQIQQLFKEDN